MKKTISEFTEVEFLEYVRKIYNASGYRTEKEHDAAVFEFENVSGHPDGSDLIFYPREDREDSPEGVVKEVKEWREKNGLPGFKPE